MPKTFRRRKRKTRKRKTRKQKTRKQKTRNIRFKGGTSPKPGSRAAAEEANKVLRMPSDSTDGSPVSTGTESSTQSHSSSTRSHSSSYKKKPTVPATNAAKKVRERRVRAAAQRVIDDVYKKLTESGAYGSEVKCNRADARDKLIKDIKKQLVSHPKWTIALGSEENIKKSDVITVIRGIQERVITARQRKDNVPALTGQLVDDEKCSRIPDCLTSRGQDCYD